MRWVRDVVSLFGTIESVQVVILYYKCAVRGQMEGMRGSISRLELLARETADQELGERLLEQVPGRVNM